MVNPNWPVAEYGWGALWDAGNGAIQIDRYVDLSPRSMSNLSASRGKQFETDQAQSGTFSLTYGNADGSLDPNNASGPFAGNMWPYQPFRARMQYPPTANLLTAVQATGGVGFATGILMPSAAQVGSDTDTNKGSINSGGGTAYQGGSVFQFHVSAAAAVNARICYTAQGAVIPGQTYTMQIRVRNVTAATSLDVKPFIGWYGPPPAGAPTAFAYGTTVTLAGGAAPGWTLLTVTGTAPAGAYGLAPGFAVATVAAAACDVQADAWQLERGPTATAFAVPGTWYPFYGGFIEGYPQSWDMENTYGIVTPTCADAFSLLPQRILSDPLTEEIKQLAPRFLYKFDDPAGSLTFSDSTGNMPAAPQGKAKYGAGNLVSGTAITSATAGGAYTGSNGTVVTSNNPNPGTAIVGAATFINLAGAGIKGPADPTTWTRMIAFRYTGPTPTDNAVMWSSMDNKKAGSGTGSFLHFLIFKTGGVAQMIVSGPGGTSSAYNMGSINVVDSNWHLITASWSQSTNTVILTLDGTTYTYSGSVSALSPFGLDSDAIGSRVDVTNGGVCTDNFKGDISFVGEFPTALNTTQSVNLYNAWKSSFVGESTDSRYTRILRYSGYKGGYAFGSGNTRSMGPAAIAGQDALTALNEVVDAEGGSHFVDSAGTLRFNARGNRYNALTPTYTFGENVAGGEFPYEDITVDNDATHLANLVTVTQTSTGQTFVGTDGTSAGKFFQRTMTKSINSTDPLECQDAANYLASRYRNPAPRIASLTLNPSAYPALWPVCLSLEQGTRIRVMRRPQGAPAIQLDVFVEHLAWAADDGNKATLTLQCSPVDLTPYAIFASWHSTLGASTLAGVSSLTINASADNVNPLAAQMMAGQQLRIGSETVTVSAVGATSPGWTTAVLTLTAPTAVAHTAGEAIYDVLPAGTADSATWDAISKFDAAAFAY